MFLPVCIVYVCMFLCFLFFFFHGPFGEPELKCTYLLTYMSTLTESITVYSDPLPLVYAMPVHVLPIVDLAGGKQ